MPLYSLNGIAPDLPDSGDVWVAPGAHVIGKVVLGEACSVWFGATLRGDNEPVVVGDGTNIQENSVLHTDMGFPLTIGRDCTIGHKAMLHGCTIGDTSLIGMDATVLNGAVIGSNCLIGAGALVTEGQEIPDGVLVVGAPAKIKRELSAEAIAGLAASAERYRTAMRRFRQGLSQVEGP